MGYFARGTGFIVIENSKIAKLALSVKILINENQRGFAWVDSYKLSEACKSKNISAIFREWGFSIEKEGDEEGRYIIDFDNKIMDEEVFLKRIAPFVTRGEIFWTGEDGALWKNEFREGNFRTLNGFVDYK
jgi:hypothetical protein